MSTLTRHEIEDRLRTPLPSGLTITPILSPKQIGDTSVDLRIGNQFVVFKPHIEGSLNPFSGSGGHLNPAQELKIVQFGKKFILHPGTLALGATFEYLQIPLDLEGQVEGRSSWARLGLQIATATHIEPGFTGVVTLELSNVGNIPLELYPGFRIAQLVLRQTASVVTNPYGNHKKYRFPIGPQFSRLYADADAKIFMSAEGSRGVTPS